MELTYYNQLGSNFLKKRAPLLRKERAFAESYNGIAGGQNDVGNSE